MLMLVRRAKNIWRGLYHLYEDSGFSMAGSVAFSFVLSLFPFCIFLGALAGVFGGKELAAAAVKQLFDVLPGNVAQALAPEVNHVMGQSRIGLMTLSALAALFFATSSMESLRAALNTAYRVHDERNYFYCLGRSALFVLVGAVAMLVMAWAVVIGPAVASKFEGTGVKYLFDSSGLAWMLRYTIAVLVIVGQLIAYHLWLVGGRRSLAEIMPGVLLSTVLWLLIAALFSRWLEWNNYARFYGTLAQLMSALIYFQVTAMIVMLGAEINRGLIEIRRVGIGAVASATH
jgi:membrane protein